MKRKYLLVLSKVSFSISVGDFVGYPPSQVTLSVKGLVANSRGGNSGDTKKIYLAKLYFTNLAFPEIRGFPLLNHHLG